ncbi:Serine/arginine repetitive matrix protein 2 [Nocardia gamkensis]|nr:Serine/arginine repetitive matrix protein 2 [Nocardia gamkensis]
MHGPRRPRIRVLRTPRRTAGPPPTGDEPVSRIARPLPSATSPRCERARPTPRRREPNPGARPVRPARSARRARTLPRARTVPRARRARRAKRVRTDRRARRRAPATSRNPTATAATPPNRSCCRSRVTRVRPGRRVTRVRTPIVRPVGTPASPGRRAVRVPTPMTRRAGTRMKRHGTIRSPMPHNRSRGTAGSALGSRSRRSGRPPGAIPSGRRRSRSARAACRCATFRMPRAAACGTTRTADRTTLATRPSPTNCCGWQGEWTRAISPKAGFRAPSWWTNTPARSTSTGSAPMPTPWPCACTRTPANSTSTCPIREPTAAGDSRRTCRWISARSRPCCSTVRERWCRPPDPTRVCVRPTIARSTGPTVRSPVGATTRRRSSSGRGCGPRWPICTPGGQPSRRGSCATWWTASMTRICRRECRNGRCGSGRRRRNGMPASSARTPIPGGGSPVDGPRTMRRYRRDHRPTPLRNRIRHAPVMIRTFPTRRGFRRAMIRTRRNRRGFRRATAIGMHRTRRIDHPIRRPRRTTRTTRRRSRAIGRWHRWTATVRRATTRRSPRATGRSTRPPTSSVNPTRPSIGWKTAPTRMFRRVCTATPMDCCTNSVIAPTPTATRTARGITRTTIPAPTATTPSGCTTSRPRNTSPII